MIGPRGWTRAFVFILILALTLNAASAEGQASLSLSLEASLPDYACLGLSLTRGEHRARLALSADEWGASLALPWLSLGSLEPAGLAAFIQGPQGLSYRLGRYEPKPFRAPAPLDAPLFGAAWGGGGGCFVAYPVADGLPAWSGAWLSPPGLPLSALTAWAALPPDSGGGAWDDPPSPALERSWHALGGSIRLGPWRSALGAGAMISCPGGDAWALRAENLLSLRVFKLESVAALCLGSWRGPSDTLAPAFLLDARLSAGAKRCSIYLDYEETRPEWNALPRRDIQVGGKADVLFARLEASAGASIGASAEAPGLELRWKATPLMLPGLSAYGSWGLEGLEPRRLELGSSLKAGKARELSLDALWRADSEGRFLKLGCSYAFRFPRGRLYLYLRTDGWLLYEPFPGGVPETALDAGLRYSQSFP